MKTAHRHAGAKDGCQGKRHGQPFHLEALFDEVEGTACVLALLAEANLIRLRQFRFRKSCCRAQERDEPHPEHSARTAKIDGRRDARQVAHAHTGTDGRTERLEGGNALIGLSPVYRQFERFLEVPELGKLQIEREKGAGPEAKKYQEGTPNYVVDRLNDSF